MGVPHQVFAKITRFLPFEFFQHSCSNLVGTLFFIPLSFKILGILFIFTLFFFFQEQLKKIKRMK